jgi:hypothetical protein
MLPSFAAPSVPAPTPAMLPLGVQQIARQRQGYANAPGGSQSEVSQQRYEPPYEGAVNVSLSSNRLLYVGLGIVLVGIIVLLAIAIADSSDDLPAPPGSPATQPAAKNRGEPAGAESPAPVAKPEGAPSRTLNPEPVRPEAFRAETAARPTGGEAAPPAVDVISVHVLSTPQGADVLLAGKLLGQTPLTVKIPRATGIVPLMVHHARFGDSTSKVDLSGDISIEVTLGTGAEPAVRPTSREPAAGRDHNDRTRPAPHDTNPHAPSAAPASSQCQSPDRINPFDTSCGGKACPVCEH